MSTTHEEYVQEFGTPDDENVFYNKKRVREDLNRMERIEEEERIQKEKEVKQVELEESKAEQRREELLNPHGAKEAKDFGLVENLTELGNAFKGGARDTVSSFVTLPERAVDIASGAMISEIKKEGKYEPDFNPLGGDLNPITKTWWGNFIRTGVHFGTMAIPIVGWGGAVAKGTGLFAKAAQMTVASSNWIIKGASIGALQDLFSEYSQDANGLQVLRDRFGFIDTPCTTKDADHPALKTVKAVCEGVGIGVPIEGTIRAIGKVRFQQGLKNNPTNDILKKVDKIQSSKLLKAEKAAKVLVDKNLRQVTRQKLFNKGIDFDKLKPETQIEQMKAVQKSSKGNQFSSWSPEWEDNLARAERKLLEDQNSIKNQTIEKAQVEVNDRSARGHKNKPVVNSWQGSPNSTTNAYDGLKTLKRIDYDWSSMDEGSVESLITPAAAEALAEAGSGIKGINNKIAKELFGDARYKKLLEQLDVDGDTIDGVYGDAFERMKDVIGGRNSGDIEPSKFWRALFNNADTKDGFNVWGTKEVLAANLLQESLFKQLKTRAIAARELIDFDNLDGVDGPLKYIRDNLIVGMEQIQRSKFLLGPEYANMIKKKGGKKLANQVLLDMHQQAKNQVDMMFDLAWQSPSDDLLRSFLEAFSMSNKINNWQDFDAYMKHKLLGHTSPDGQRQTGVLIKELQGVMMNSLLSGAKTPIRAIMGTSTATFLRPTSQILGGAGRYLGTGFTDDSTLRIGLSELNAMRQAIPESWDYFKHRLNGYWSGELSTVKNRYADYTMDDQQWDLMRYWAEDSGRASDGEKAAFQLSNVSRWHNHSNWFAYTMKVLSATDDAFTMILARARSRSKALMGAMEARTQGLIPDISPEVIREYEARLQDEIFNPQTGVVNDNLLAYARGEVTLTKDLTGWGKALDTMFSTFPQTKPFYLFARTGINGLELTMKHAPGFNLFVEEFRDIARATPDNLDTVIKYGIETAQELKNAKDLQMGRLAIGTGIMYQAIDKYLVGDITGNGPTDLKTRKAWEASGWRPREIKLGGIWVSYDAFEPFNSILAYVADLGDHQRLLGDKYIERGLLSSSLALSKGMVTKTYLQGLTSLTDLFSNNPKKIERIIPNLMNGFIPSSTLRNDIGKVINPYMKELNSDFEDTLRNRNQLLEYFADEEDRLPVKYDILNGRPIRDWDLPTRLFNFISPVQLNFDQSPGRKFLFRSQFNINLATTTAPDGTSLADNAQLRSKFQKGIGDQNLELKLEKLSQRKDVIESLNQMEADIRAGLHKKKPGINPMSYTHNKLIGQLINDAKAKAWAAMRSDPQVVTLMEAARKEQISENLRTEDPQESRKAYEEANKLLEMTNK